MPFFTFTFPLWVQVTHWINAVLMIFLIRAGIQILSDHPKLYWNDDAMDGTEWIKFGKKIMPKDKLWTSMDEAENVSSLIALPGGRHNLGSGRRWHFLAALTWVVNGVVYVFLLFATGMWKDIVPTSWSIIPESLHTFVTYATFHTPPASAFTPFDPLQQLTYFLVIFVLAPLQIATGLCMSPAFIGRFPWYAKLFGGRQSARSIHFIIMLLFVAFIVVHVTLVLAVGFPSSIGSMTAGTGISMNAGILIFFGIIAGLILINIWATWYTLADQRRWQILGDRLLEPLMEGLFGRLVSRQRYTREDISPYHRVNGYPPTTPEWLALKENGFKDWKLRVGGLVEEEAFFSLEDLQKLPKAEHIAKHNCIQGWSAVAEWGGVQVSELLKHVKVKPEAKYIVFYAYDIKDDGYQFYGSLPLSHARRPQTILAYEMNWNPLPIPHGAPLRLRVESKLGFKMVKYIKAIELADDIRDIRKGRGGYREDNQFYDTVASI
ncbi:MAG TPA: molybdopterin-dependent oxidoreductase [Candidatus Paceibacterota bacterium]|nr:molybdopterin-dependent oxidoreductase [Candidatus Paceibacterota bacterium]